MMFVYLSAEVFGPFEQLPRFTELIYSKKQTTNSQNVSATLCFDPNTDFLARIDKLTWHILRRPFYARHARER